MGRRVLPVGLLTALLFVLAACSLESLPVNLPPLPWQGPEEPLTVELVLAGWETTTQETAYLAQLLRALSTIDPSTPLSLRLEPNYAAFLNTLGASTRPPDLLLSSGYQLPGLIAGGILSPLPAALDGTSDLYASLRTGFGTDSTAYCYPRGVHTLALAYNRDLFDKAGLPYPDLNWTWTELRDAAQRLTNANSGRAGLVLMADFSRWLPFYYQAGGTDLQLRSASMQLTSPAATQALAYLLEMFLAGVAAEADLLNSTWSGEAFGKERAAMTIEGGWLISYLQAEFPHLNYGITHLPAGPSAEATIAYTSCLGVTAHNSNVDAAHHVAAFLTSAQQLPNWNEHAGEIPPYPSLAAALVARVGDYEPFISSIDSARVWQLPTGLESLPDIFNNALREAIYDPPLDEEGAEASPEQAAKEILARIQEAAQPLQGSDLSTIEK